MGVIVTGAGSGMGKATARLLASQGRAVGVNDLVAERAQEAAAEINAAVGKDLAIPLPGDVADEQGANGVIAGALKTWGTITGLVNAAGIAKGGSIRDGEISAWEIVMKVNFFGAYLCTRAAWDALVESKGAVVNFASISAELPASRVGAYSASKAAVISLTQQTAIEGGPLGLRANAVSPGFITGTIMSSSADANKELSELRGQRVPLRRLGNVDDVASVVSFLLSEGARYINGEIVRVDGGIGISLMEQLPRQAKRD